jgi:hypothetical protein
MLQVWGLGQEGVDSVLRVVHICTFMCVHAHGCVLVGLPRRTSPSRRRNLEPCASKISLIHWEGKHRTTSAPSPVPSKWLLSVKMLALKGLIC